MRLSVEKRLDMLNKKYEEELERIREFRNKLENEEQTTLLDYLLEKEMKYVEGVKR